MVSECCRDYINRHFLETLFSLLGYVRNFFYQPLYFAVKGWAKLRRQGLVFRLGYNQIIPFLRKKNEGCTDNIAGSTRLS